MVGRRALLAVIFVGWKWKVCCSSSGLIGGRGANKSLGCSTGRAAAEAAIARCFAAHGSLIDFLAEVRVKNLTEDARVPLNGMIDCLRYMDRCIAAGTSCAGVLMLRN